MNHENYKINETQLCRNDRGKGRGGFLIGGIHFFCIGTTGGIHIKNIKLAYPEAAHYKKAFLIDGFEFWTKLEDKNALMNVLKERNILFPVEGD